VEKTGREKRKEVETIMPTTRRFVMFCLSIVLAGFLGCASSNKSESTGEYFDDATITTKVKTAILQEPTLKVTQIGVETYKGQVQLSGFVASDAEKSKASEIARGVAGVKSVRNDIRLR
jgi:osmotically-inducible protein OsmY